MPELTLYESLIECLNIKILLKRLSIFDVLVLAYNSAPFMD
jgi:hypothetical protein